MSEANEEGGGVRGERGEGGGVRGESLVGHLPGDGGTGEGHFAGHVVAAVLVLADAVGREGIGGDDVGPGVDVGAVDALYHFGSRQAEHVVIARQRHRPVGKPPPVVVFRREAQGLNLGAHRPVEYHDALLQYRF